MPLASIRRMELGRLLNFRTEIDSKLYPKTTKLWPPSYLGLLSSATLKFQSQPVITVYESTGFLAQTLRLNR